MKINSLNSLFSLRNLGAACLIIGAGAFITSCSENDGPDNPVIDPVENHTSTGVYVITQGNYYSQVEGSLTYLTYNGFNAESGLFEKANQRSLGATPQCGLVYGSHVFLGMSDSSTIEICSGATMKSEKQIKCDSKATGRQPRSMVAQGDYVYISMFDGNVARLDTTTLSIDKVVEVGPNPETMAIHNGKLWVPNSDGMNWAVGYGTTASIIDLASFTVENTVKVPLNPNQFISAGGKLFLLSKGNYADVESALYEINPDIANIQKDESKKETAWKKLANATIVSGENYGSIYIVDAPFVQGAVVVNYSRYDIAAGEVKEWTPAGLDYPSDLAVDPVSGNIIVTSYIMDGMYPSYVADGYANLYSADGALLKKFNIGAGTPAIFFNTK